MWRQWLSAEQTPSMVGADFGSAEDAESAADAVRSAQGLEASRLHIIRPGDPHLERKLEPESRGIAGTLVRAHLVLGFLGLLAGLVLSLALVGQGIRPFDSSPAISIGVITAFTTIAGLLAGGLFTMRPDHDPIINEARRSAESGRWFVLVHARRPEQRKRARSVLRQFSDDTVQTA